LKSRQDVSADPIWQLIWEIEQSRRGSEPAVIEQRQNHCLSPMDIEIARVRAANEKTHEWQETRQLVLTYKHIHTRVNTNG
jgi:hypothetical protein